MDHRPKIPDCTDGCEPPSGSPREDPDVIAWRQRKHERLMQFLEEDRKWRRADLERRWREHHKYAFACRRYMIYLLVAIAIFFGYGVQCAPSRISDTAAETQNGPG